MGLTSARIPEIYNEFAFADLQDEDILVVYRESTGVTGGVKVKDMQIGDTSQFEWSGTVIYAINEVVTYQGKWWQSDQNANEGNIPTDGVWWTQINKVSGLIIPQWQSGLFTEHEVLQRVGTSLFSLKNTVTLPFNSVTSPDLDLTDWEYVGFNKATITGDASGVQNTVTADISGQTGVKTFDSYFQNIVDTGRTSTGEANFINLQKNNVSKFKIDVDGNLTISTGTLMVSPELDTTLLLGKMKITQTIGGSGWVGLGHYNSQYAFRQHSSGYTTFNTPSGTSMQFDVNNSQQWQLGSNGDFIASNGNHLNLSATSAIQIVAVNAIAFDATQNVTIPNGSLITNREQIFTEVDFTALGVPSAGTAYVGMDLNDSKFKVKNDAGTTYVMGGGDVTKVGTPVNNELTVWTGDGTIEGESSILITSKNITVGATGATGSTSIQIGNSLLNAGSFFATYSNNPSVLSVGADFSGINSGSGTSRMSLKTFSGESFSVYENGVSSKRISTGISSSSDDYIITNGNRVGTGVELFRVAQNGNIGLNGSSFGNGVKVIFIANGTAPSGNPVGGGIMYVESGALKYRGSSGTITTIAVA